MILMKEFTNYLVNNSDEIDNKKFLIFDKMSDLEEQVLLPLVIYIIFNWYF